MSNVMQSLCREKEAHGKSKRTAEEIGEPSSNYFRHRSTCSDPLVMWRKHF